MRHNVAFPWHDFEAIFYIGIALTLFSLILLYFYKMTSEKLIITLSFVASLVFGLSVLRMAQLKTEYHEIQKQKEEIADFEIIRDLTEGKVIWDKTVSVDAVPYSRYYLSGRVIIHRSNIAASEARLADYVTTHTRLDGPALLTPDNRAVYLYDRAAYVTQINKILRQLDAPAIRSDFFDVYLNENMLIYVKEPCNAVEIDKPIFLALYPADESDLPPSRKPHGFDNLDFYFHKGKVWQTSERCVAIAPPLPGYDIARIYIRQYTQRADGPTSHIWEGEIHMTEPAR